MLEQIDERTRRELALTRKLYIVWGVVALALGLTFCYIVANAFQSRAPLPIVVGQVDDFALNSMTLTYVNASFLDPETHKALETLPLDVSRDASGNFTIFFARSTDPARGILIPRQCAVDWDEATQRLVEPCGGTQWTREGVYVQGPGARDLDRFKTRVVNGNVMIDLELIEGNSRS